MKRIYASLIAVFLFVFSISALAGGVPWNEPIKNASRFRVLESYNNEAVLDRETGLVWERGPGTNTATPPHIRLTAPWFEAHFQCNQRTWGNRKGWRLPTIQELASLVDVTVPPPGPVLPARHPFINVQSQPYWAATTFAAPGIPDEAYLLNFGDGNMGSTLKDRFNHYWCVRGGQGDDPH
jgi:hypothetical protein